MKLPISSAVLAALAAAGVLLSGCGQAASPALSYPGVPDNAIKVEEAGGFDAAMIQNGALIGQPLHSPLSAYLALAMAAEGARGDTAAIFEAAGIDPDEASARIASLEAIGDETKLSIAQSVWVDEALKVREEFMAAMDEKFAAEAFTCRLALSVDRINSWVEKKTEGLIPRLLDDIQADAAMILINTLYMDAKWAVPFEANNTREGDFHTADQKTVRVDYMNSERHLGLIDTDKFEGVVLPYSDGRLMFTAVKVKDGADASLGDADPAALAAGSVNTLVRLSLPKFEAETSYSMKDLLSAIGMEGIFAPSADFSGIADGIAVSDVIQNVKIKVDEAGTEAAAATAVILKYTGVFMPQGREVTFDSPFAWAITDGQTGAVLFAGTFTGQ